MASPDDNLDDKSDMRRSQSEADTAQSGFEETALAESAETELRAWLAFHFAGVSWPRLQDVKAVFGTLTAALNASDSQWRQYDCLTANQRKRLLDPQQPQWQAQALAWQQQPCHHLLTYDSPDYPAMWRQLTDPPILVYVKGTVSVLHQPQLAIVGGRKASQSGQATARAFAQDLAEKGLVITSGLASGVDKAAHQGALQSGVSHTTVAVVATGLDRVYPAANHALAQAVVDQGVMVSEYPLGTRPKPWHFPARNRLISGLSLGTLVIEAALKSGSLITAKQALDQGREVFAVPGSIHDPKVKGCHQLIRDGAKLVETSTHILEELAAWLQPMVQPLLTLEADKTHAPQAQEADERPESDKEAVWAAVDYEPTSLETMMAQSGLSQATVQSQLVMLELEDRVEALSAGRWRRCEAC